MPRRRHRRSNKRTKTADYVRFLSIAPGPKTTRSVIQNAPDSVIKAVSNAALNAQRGQVRLSPSQKRLFARHRGLFDYLSSPRPSVPAKRKRLVSQRGGALPLIPILLGTVLGTLGSTFLRNVGSSKKE